VLGALMNDAQIHDAIVIPDEMMRRWTALLIESVQRAGSLNVNLIDVTVSATEIHAHQVRRRPVSDGIGVIRIAN
jgi:hypothetical protein